MKTTVPMLDAGLKLQYLHSAVTTADATTPEACGKLAELLRWNPEHVTGQLLKHIEDIRSSLFILLVNAGGFDNPQLRKIMMCIQPDPRKEPAIDETYRRAAGIYVPGQDIQEVLVQLMKFSNRASELLRKELRE